jgi:glycosyltransferase involved in cell wall biosynthesis
VPDWVSRRALDKYRGLLVTVIEQRRRDLCGFLGEQGRIRAIPNGVELFDLTQRHALREARRAELDVAQDSLLIVAVGRMVPQKRPLLFLELAERIHKRLPRSRFIWVGDGALSPDWDRLVAGRQLAGIILRLPWQKNVRDILFAADAFLHVAEFEGLPLALLEAFSAGLPCAITPNLLQEMPFLDENNSLAITDDGPWTEVLSDPRRLALLGRNARRIAEEQFSFDMMAERYESLYRETIAQQS